MPDSRPPYQLIRSARRTMAIEVRPGPEVVVRVPYRCSDRQARHFVAQHVAWIDRKLQELADRLPLSEPDAAEEARLRALAAQWLPGRVAYYADLLGVSPRSIRVTGARKRFGSCSTLGSLCFSFLLMRYPDAAVDYVVLHEVAHLLHHNHSAAFYQTIASVMPDYKLRMALLRQPPPAQEGGQHE
ncbi:MAG: M48 family metallopeptidase [Clostridiales bacterium]|nr:M48 family metallopeptidase [Clostridiales bacterium]